MRCHRCIRLAVPLLLLLAAPAAAADWKPAPTPLLTRWGKAIDPEKAWAEYPRPQLVRKDWQNLNGLWDYAVTPKGATRPERWDGKLLVPFCLESALSGVGKSLGADKHLWYRRDLKTPAAWTGRRVLLHFQAVDWETTVFVNGKEVGTHRGGFDPFHFDVTDALKDGAGELVVRVWDPTDKGSQPLGKQLSNPHGIWYTPVSGIWQTVWLEPVPLGRIRAVRPEPDVDSEKVTFRIDTEGLRDGDQLQVHVGQATVTRLGEHDGKPVLVQRVAEPMPPPITIRGIPGAPVTLRLPGRAPWTPDAPVLHQVTVSVLRGDQAVDTIETYFALRKISVGKDERGLLRMLLNNQPLFQLGPLDQGWWPDGLLTPPSDEAMRYDLIVLKQIGMNMLRKHIKVEPARLYHYCDHLGLLVWQDMPSVINRTKKHFIAPNAREDAVFTAEEKATFRTELKAMMDHLRFFPSIVVWVPFNEGWGQHDTNDVLKWVKEYDPSRLVDGPSGWTDRGYGDLKDMHRYPGPGMFPVLDDRVSVLGEFGGLGLPVKGHLWKDQGNWGYRTYKSKEELNEAYRLLIRRLHPLIGRGLAAAVYTQTTDVEIEVNGLMTYDREVLKIDVAAAAKWHQALSGPPPRLVDVLPTSERNRRTWKYVLEQPGDGWEKSEFGAADWKSGPGGFGTAGTPGAVLGTEWKTSNIWLRQEFELREVPTGDLELRVHHDEDAEVYINGVLAARVVGYVTEYQEVPLSLEGRRALRAGKNVLAVHCKQTGGGQYIDVGIVELQAAPRR